MGDLLEAMLGRLISPNLGLEFTVAVAHISDFSDYFEEYPNRCCIVAPPVLFVWEQTQLFSQHY
jgi:hypothetical protein